ncbi:hypothetical protein Pmani_013731 [Petrolisthes manimaculis]|uniref:Uncharacterized protein n=1 Tax=Petrolisthes manimaculis TaxID=1843537 RepID=A0AAE1PXS1_9EUCA|nr:hypothetical protein Pmani_013731 [Petrolisthes manimaculis]
MVVVVVEVEKLGRYGGGGGGGEIRCVIRTGNSGKDGEEETKWGSKRKELNEEKEERKGNGTEVREVLYLISLPRLYLISLPQTLPNHSTQTLPHLSTSALYFISLPQPSTSSLYPSPLPHLSLRLYLIFLPALTPASVYLSSLVNLSHLSPHLSTSTPSAPLLYPALYTPFNNHHLNSFPKHLSIPSRLL